VAVRYPRGAGPGRIAKNELNVLPLGKGEIRRQSSRSQGERIAILAFGSMLMPSLAAALELDASVANMRFVKPLDIDLVEALACSHDLLVTIEEGCVKGGAGAACLEHLAASGIPRQVLQLGFDDQFIEHGASEQLMAARGLDAQGIITSIRLFQEQLALLQPLALPVLSVGGHSLIGRQS